MVLKEPVVMPLSALIAEQKLGPRESRVAKSFSTLLGCTLQTLEAVAWLKSQAGLVPICVPLASVSLRSNGSGCLSSLRSFVRTATLAGTGRLSHECRSLALATVLADLHTHAALELDAVQQNAYGAQLHLLQHIAPEVRAAAGQSLSGALTPASWDSIGNGTSQVVDLSGQASFAAGCFIHSILEGIGASAAQLGLQQPHQLPGLAMQAGALASPAAAAALASVFGPIASPPLLALQMVSAQLMNPDPASRMTLDVAISTLHGLGLAQLAAPQPPPPNFRLLSLRVHCGAASSAPGSSALGSPTAVPGGHDGSINAAADAAAASALWGSFGSGRSSVTSSPMRMHSPRLYPNASPGSGYPYGGAGDASPDHQRGRFIAIPVWPQQTVADVTKSALCAAGFKWPGSLASDLLQQQQQQQQVQQGSASSSRGVSPSPLSPGNYGGSSMWGNSATAQFQLPPHQLEPSLVVVKQDVLSGSASPLMPTTLDPQSRIGDSSTSSLLFGHDCTVHVYAAAVADPQQQHPYNGFSNGIVAAASSPLFAPLNSGSSTYATYSLHRSSVASTAIQSLVSSPARGNGNGGAGSRSAALPSSLTPLGDSGHHYVNTGRSSSRMGFANNNYSSSGDNVEVLLPGPEHGVGSNAGQQQDYIEDVLAGTAEAVLGSLSLTQHSDHEAEQRYGDTSISGSTLRATSPNYQPGSGRASTYTSAPPSPPRIGRTASGDAAAPIARYANPSQQQPIPPTISNSASNSSGMVNDTLFSLGNGYGIGPLLDLGVGTGTSAKSSSSATLLSTGSTGLLNRANSGAFGNITVGSSSRETTPSPIDVYCPTNENNADKTRSVALTSSALLDSDAAAEGEETVSMLSLHQYRSGDSSNNNVSLLPASGRRSGLGTTARSAAPSQVSSPAKPSRTSVTTPTTGVACNNVVLASPVAGSNSGHNGSISSPIAFQQQVAADNRKQQQLSYPLSPARPSSSMSVNVGGPAILSPQAKQAVPAATSESANATSTASKQINSASMPAGSPASATGSSTTTPSTAAASSSSVTAAAPLPPLPPAQMAELLAFGSDLFQRLRSFGAHLTTVGTPVNGAPVRLVFDAGKTDTRNVIASLKTPARINDLRDRLRSLQDRSHSRDDLFVRHLGAAGYLELSAAAVVIGAQTLRDAVTTSYALQAVGNLAMEDSCRQRLASMGMIEMVIDAMRAFPGSSGSRVQKDAMVALRHLAYENDANKQRILDAGGIAAVIRAMDDCGDNPQVQRQACGSISILAVHSTLGDSGKASIVRGGGMRSIVSAMDKHRSDAQLVIAGVKALATLMSCPEARTAAAEMRLAEYLEQLCPGASAAAAVMSGSGGGSNGSAVPSTPNGSSHKSSHGQHQHQNQHNANNGELTEAVKAALRRMKA